MCVCGGVWVIRMSVERGMREDHGGVAGSYWKLGGGVSGVVFDMCDGGDVRVGLVAASGDIGGAVDVEAAPAFKAQVRGAIV